MPDFPFSFPSGVLGSVADLYVVSQNYVRVRIILVNTTASAVTVNMYVKGVSESTNRRICPKDLVFGAGYSAELDVEHTLGPGDKIIGEATGNVDFSIHGEKVA